MAVYFENHVTCKHIERDKFRDVGVKKLAVHIYGYALKYTID